MFYKNILVAIGLHQEIHYLHCFFAGKMRKVQTIKHVLFPQLVELEVFLIL